MCADVKRAQDDMLAALKAVDHLWSKPLNDFAPDFEQEVEWGSPVGKVWKLIRDAIAKAEGHDAD